MSTSTTHSIPMPDPATLKTGLRLLELGLWPILIWQPEAAHEAAGKAPIGEEWGKKKHTADPAAAPTAVPSVPVAPTVHAPTLAPAPITQPVTAPAAAL